ncbi:MAG: M81 family metallopeptidase, partial [Draconibacterium sp.]|nr:M81 family metallopeptidase [Draconibacterium sp.]
SMYDDVEAVGINSPDYVYGGSSRSWNSKESFEHFMNIICEDLNSKLPVDGVYLALQGALAVRDVPKPEAEIAKRIREIVGVDVPIAATFDLHGNEDEEFLKHADASFVTKRYPHYDTFLQGGKAADFLYRTIKGRFIPTTATTRPPVVTATVLQWTGQSPSMDIMERARRWEARQKDVTVNVFYGFPWSDVPDIGTTVQVITNNNQPLADSIAKDMSDFIWRVRTEFAGEKYLMPKEAVFETEKAIIANKTPIVLADYSDRPGDATWILHEIINNNLEKVYYATLRDEKVIESLIKAEAKTGDSLEMSVGGFSGEQAGPPVFIKGTLKYFGPKWNYDKIAVIEFGKKNLLVISPALTQIIYPDQLRIDDINPEDYEVFVVKSRVHFRRGFDETGFAKSIFIVDAPGPWFGTTRLGSLNYQYGPINELYPFNK